ncbi:MAG: hypothetical protein CSYNP_04452 [Syntrophus sp. SKADARSKE-3]|nr:hypothetical protein [Syntrophus sp. SKADARSKE-3]
MKGENPFKIRAYQNAARHIESLEDFDRLVAEGKLSSIKGIGEALTAKITELVSTGSLAYYENLKKEIPPGRELPFRHQTVKIFQRFDMACRILIGPYFEGVLALQFEQGGDLIKDSADVLFGDECSHFDIHASVPYGRSEETAGFPPSCRSSGRMVMQR